MKTNKLDFSTIRSCFTNITYFSTKFNKVVGGVVKDVNTMNAKLYVVNSGECVWIYFSEVKSIIN